MSQSSLANTLAKAAIVPVVTIQIADQAVPLAAALADGGLPLIEVTMRTPAALDAIAAVRTALPDIAVGAGTVLDEAALDQALAAGATFFVSPGASLGLINAVSERGLQDRWLPGAATPSEMMALRDAGYRLQKFFPAEQSGGIALLKSVAAPLSDLTFCPTGGIGQNNARDYLALGNVTAVGGSWVAPQAAIEAGAWPDIRALAQSARRAVAELP
jgi:2-dehydro-3-deoxyphosphogluconate aldolase/(4S)-4-hydroxy-2-oxoglutarate aldolase